MLLQRNWLRKRSFRIPKYCRSTIKFRLQVAFGGTVPPLFHHAKQIHRWVMDLDTFKVKDYVFHAGESALPALLLDLGNVRFSNYSLSQMFESLLVLALACGKASQSKLTV